MNSYKSAPAMSASAEPRTTPGVAAGQSADLAELVDGCGLPPLGDSLLRLTPVHPRPPANTHQCVRPSENTRRERVRTFILSDTP